MDNITKKQRSELMGKIKSVSMLETLSKAYVREIARCRLVHQPGGIFGRPDFANKAQRVAVFVHSCFFHFPCPERCCKLPKTNRDFWREKFKRNKARHEEVLETLSAQGWKIFTIWEHDIRRAVKC